MYPRKRGGGGSGKETTVEREVLVEEFEDEPDKANNNGPPDQGWVDDEMNSGAMVAYGYHPNASASGGVAPYESGEKDAAQRQAILDGKKD
jgi:hypothetical protein